MYSTPSLSALGTIYCTPACFPELIHYQPSSEGHSDLQVLPDSYPTVTPDFTELKLPPCSSPTCSTPEPSFYDYSVIDHSGANHHLGQTGTNSWMSRDATGYSLITTVTPTDTEVLTDRNGTRYSAPVNPQPTYNGVPYGPVTCCYLISTIEDTNGNLLTSPGLPSTPIVWTDTLGRQIPERPQTTTTDTTG